MMSRFGITARMSPVEQDRPEARDDSGSDGKEHEAELRREPGQLPRKPIPKLFDDFRFVIIQIICVESTKQVS